MPIVYSFPSVKLIRSTVRLGAKLRPGSNSQNPVGHLKISDSTEFNGCFDRYEDRREKHLPIVNWEASNLGN